MRNTLFRTAEKNWSTPSARDKATIEYISGRQPSPYELAFEVELGSNPHSKNGIKAYPRFIKGVTHYVIRAPSPLVLGVRGYVEKNLSLKSDTDKVTIEYISGRQPSPYELVFGV